jgi:hypothetical protein
MNPLGAFIWEKLDGRPTLQELEAAIGQAYEVDPRVAAADLFRFVEELESAGAVRRV